MKNLFKVFGFLGLLAFGISSCNQQGQDGKASPEGEIKAEEGIADLKIAYIQTDSVITKFDYFKTKSAEITEKGKKFESELGNRARGFEQEVANFEQTAGSMTINQQRAKQEELVNKERNLVTYRDNLMQELSSDEAKLYSDVYDRVQEFLVEYAEQNDLELVLSYTRGGAVWYSKKAFDITDDVIAGLNKKYAESQVEKK